MALEIRCVSDMNIYYLFTFESTHLAIQTERSLKATLAVTMIPTPRELTASCGLSLRVQESDFNAAKAILCGDSFEGIHLYRVERIDDGPRSYVAVEWGC